MARGWPIGPRGLTREGQIISREKFNAQSAVNVMVHLNMREIAYFPLAHDDMSCLGNRAGCRVIGANSRLLQHDQKKRSWSGWLAAALACHRWEKGIWTCVSGRGLVNEGGGAKDHINAPDKSAWPCSWRLSRRARSAWKTSSGTSLSADAVIGREEEERVFFLGGAAATGRSRWELPRVVRCRLLPLALPLPLWPVAIRVVEAAMAPLITKLEMAAAAAITK